MPLFFCWFPYIFFSSYFEFDWNFHSYLFFLPTQVRVCSNEHCRWYSFPFWWFRKQNYGLEYKKECAYVIWKWAFVSLHVDQHYYPCNGYLWVGCCSSLFRKIWILTANRKKNSILNLPIVTSWQLRWFGVLFILHRILVTSTFGFRITLTEMVNHPKKEYVLLDLVFHFRVESWQPKALSTSSVLVSI